MLTIRYIQKMLLIWEETNKLGKITPKSKT